VVPRPKLAISISMEKLSPAATSCFSTVIFP